MLEFFLLITTSIFIGSVTKMLLITLYFGKKKKNEVLDMKKRLVYGPGFL